MTISQLIPYLQIELDKQGGYSSAAFIESELIYFLSELYCNTIRRIMSKYAQSKVFSDEVNLLLTRISYPDNASNCPKVYKNRALIKNLFDLNSLGEDGTTPCKAGYLIGVRLGSPIYADCVEIDVEQQSKFLTTEYNVPMIQHPVYCVIGKDIAVYVTLPDDSNVTYAEIGVYQPTPSDNDDSEIIDLLFHVVIEEAALLLLGNMESSRFETMDNITQNNMS